MGVEIPAADHDQVIRMKRFEIRFWLPHQVNELDGGLLTVLGKEGDGILASVDLRELLVVQGLDRVFGFLRGHLISRFSASGMETRSWNLGATHFEIGDVISVKGKEGLPFATHRKQPRLGGVAAAT
jgi:hypothetical protein